MANVFSPQGFTPVRRQDGAAWTANINSYKIAKADTNTMYQGDPVVLLNTGFVTAASSPNSTSQALVGVFLGVYYLSKSLSRRVFTNQWSVGNADANSNGDALIVDDPNVIFRVWVGTGASSAAGGPAVQADVGAGFQWRYGTPNTSSGLSGAYIDYATKATSSAVSNWMMTGQVLDPPGMNGTDVTTAGNLIEVKPAFGQFQAGLTVV